jgi:hypothetical protein
MHRGVALEREQLEARTDPGAHTRERSLRIRSTIIRFSARSFALSVSAWPSAAFVLGAHAGARTRALDSGRFHGGRRALTRRNRSGDVL